MLMFGRPQKFLHNYHTWVTLLLRHPCPMYSTFCFLSAVHVPAGGMNDDLGGLSFDIEEDVGLFDPEVLEMMLAQTS